MFLGKDLLERFTQGVSLERDSTVGINTVSTTHNESQHQAAPFTPPGL